MKKDNGAGGSTGDTSFGEDNGSSTPVSGVDGWLFYKPQFNSGKCLSGEYLGRVLDGVTAMRTVAKAVGIDLRFSVSPDKSVVHPEKLGFSRNLVTTGTSKRVIAIIESAGGGPRHLFRRKGG